MTVDELDPDYDWTRPPTTPRPDFPVLRDIRGEPVLDLLAIPREWWFQALLPLTLLGRRECLSAAGLHEQSQEAGPLWLELQDADITRPAAIRAAAKALPRALVEPEYRQVSIRLAHDEYAKLGAVAEELSLKPTQVVRMLVRDGVARMAYEQQRLTGS